MSSSSAAAPPEIQTDIKYDNNILTDNKLPDNIAPFRVIDGIHDFYEPLQKYTANTVLSNDYNINSLILNQNNNTIIGPYDIKKTSPGTLQNLIDMYNNKINSNTNLNLCKSQRECYNFESPTKIPTISYTTLKEHIDIIIENNTLPLTGNYIINITGKKNEILPNESEKFDEVINLIKRLVNYPLSNTEKEYYSLDASKLPKFFFEKLYNNNNNSYLSGLVDPASIKGKQINANVEYNILYTYYKNIPIYCKIQQINANSFRLGFSKKYDNNYFYNNNNTFTFDTGTLHFSPGIDKIAQYINDNIKKNPVKGLQNRANIITKSGQKVLENSNISNIIDLTISQLQTENSIDWKLLFEVIIEKFKNAVLENNTNNSNNSNNSAIDITYENKINALISFKTIGDQMYFYDACMLKNFNDNKLKFTTLVSSDSFLVDYAINRKEVNVFYSSGKNGKRNIIYYKAPIDKNKIEGIQERENQIKETNYKTIIKTIEDSKFYLINIILKMNDYYNQCSNIFFKDIKITDVNRINKIYILSKYITEKLSISPLILTLLYYSMWKLYLQYLDVLNTAKKILLIEIKDIDPTNNTLLEFLNMKSKIDIFNEVITNLSFDSYEDMKQTIFTILDLNSNTTVALNIISENILSYTQLQDNSFVEIYDTTINIDIYLQEVLDELDFIYKTIKISNFNFNSYLMKVKGYNWFFTWYTSGFNSFKSFKNNYIDKNIRILNLGLEVGDKRKAEIQLTPSIVLQDESIIEGGGITNTISYEEVKTIINKQINNALKSDTNDITQIIFYIIDISNTIDTVQNLSNINKFIDNNNFYDSNDFYDYLNRDSNLTENIKKLNEKYDSLFKITNKLEYDSISNSIKCVEEVILMDDGSDVESVESKMVDSNQPDINKKKESDNFNLIVNNNYSSDSEKSLDFTSQESYSSASQQDNKHNITRPKTPKTPNVVFNNFNSPDTVSTNSSDFNRKNDNNNQNLSDVKQQLFIGGKTKKVKKLKNVKKYLTKRKVNKIQLNKKKTIKRKNKKIVKKIKHSKKR
jgi:hypothetical protein